MSKESSSRKILNRIVESSTILATTTGLFALAVEALHLLEARSPLLARIPWLDDLSWRLSGVMPLIIGVIGVFIGYVAARPRHGRGSR